MKIHNLTPKVVYDVDALVEDVLLLQNGSSHGDTLTQSCRNTADNINPLADVLSKLDWESSALMDVIPGTGAEVTLPTDADGGDDGVCSSSSVAAQSCSEPDLTGKKEESGEKATLVPPLVFAATSESCNLRKAIQVGLCITIVCAFH